MQQPEVEIGLLRRVATLEIEMRQVKEMLRVFENKTFNQSEYNLPRQKYIEQGLFIIKSSRVQLPTGQVVEKNTTKVTAKGQEYFINKFIYDQLHNA